MTVLNPRTLPRPRTATVVKSTLMASATVAKIVLRRTQTATKMSHLSHRELLTHQRIAMTARREESAAQMAPKR